MADSILIDRAVVQQALEALKSVQDHRPNDETNNAITALRAALAQAEPVQEPVAWGCFKGGELQSELIGTKADADFWVASDEPHMQGMVAGPLYTAPPQRKPLTEEEMRKLWSQYGYKSALCMRFARAIEQAHGIKEAK